mgnify:CR=1 FL=1
MLDNLNLKGVIHIGANIAQEADLYETMSAKVIWIEALYNKELSNKINSYQNQFLINELVTDKDSQEYKFYISNNNQSSSSILKLKEHKELWPEVSYTKEVTLVSKKLDSIITENKINPEEYTTLILDTQGSELLILKGAKDYLKTCEQIVLEAPNFESYENCPQVKDFDNLLSTMGFKQVKKECFKKNKQKEYYDILYIKQP